MDKADGQGLMGPAITRGMLLIGILAALGCFAKEESASSQPPPRISISVSLNQVPTDLSGLTPALQKVVDVDGTVRTIWAVRVSDWLDRLLGEDAAQYSYNLIGREEGSLLECMGGNERQLPSYEDLRHAFFCDEGSEDKGGRGLRILWDEPKASCFYRDRMDRGSVVSYPNWGALEKKQCSYVMEMKGATSAHEGETVYVEGVATMGTGVMACHRYFKIHIQNATGGIYVFADMEPAVAEPGYDGSTFANVTIYPGDRVVLKGTIRSRNGMVELRPASGYHVAVLGRGESLPAPHVFASANEIHRSRYEYVGDLVRVKGVRLRGPDTAALWPQYGQEANGIELETEAPHENQGLQMDIKAGSGIPGSNPPRDSFDIIGVLHRQVAETGSVSYVLFPRGLSDIHPLRGSPISGPQIEVYKAGHPEDAVTIPLSRVPQCLYDTGRTSGGQPVGPEPVATLDSLIVPQMTLSPQNWVYKIVARDGRQPDECLQFSQLKSGVLYQSEGAVNTYFFPGVHHTQIFCLNDLARIVLYPTGDGLGHPSGEARHGEGVNLSIHGTNYPVILRDLPDPGPTPLRPLSDLVPDSIIDSYTMSGFFSADQIRALYDYRLVSYGGAQECTVTWEAMQAGRVHREGALNVVGLEGCALADLFTIEMIRKLIVDDGMRERTFCWRDLPTRQFDVGGGKMETVVFFDDVLDAIGVQEAEKPHYDYLLWAPDDFGVYFPYGHNHLKEMYFDPVTNKGFVTNKNPDMPGFGGCFSTKAILRITLRPIPQGPPSLHANGLGWLPNPESKETCYGCHIKDQTGKLKIRVNCAECHP